MKRKKDYEQNKLEKYQLNDYKRCINDPVKSEFYMLIRFYLFLKEIFNLFPQELIRFIILKIEINCIEYKCISKGIWVDVFRIAKFTKKIYLKKTNICYYCYDYFGSTTHHLKFKGIICNKHLDNLEYCIFCNYKICKDHLSTRIVSEMIGEYCKGCGSFICDKCVDESPYESTSCDFSDSDSKTTSYDDLVENYLCKVCRSMDH